MLGNIGHTVLLKLPVQLEGTKAVALLDSGAETSYVSPEAVKRAGLSPQVKDSPYPLHVANGKRMPGTPLISEEVTARMQTQRHHEDITLDVMPGLRWDVILGLPWLRKHNPDIDWEKGRLSFQRCERASTAKPAHRQSSMADERAINNIVSRPEVDKHESTLVDAGRNHQVTEKRKAVSNSTTHVIPEQYKEWSHLFREEEGAAALPRHKPWDHRIDLEEGKTPPFGPLYAQSEKELQWTRDFLKKALDRKWIRESTSSAASPLIFVAKKDGTPRPCIDYRKLNNITPKNRYPLPNISELRDRLSRVKIFTAMDLRDGYHLIRIKQGDEWKTAFRTRYGLYEYQVMPFGLTNAPATFQALINDVLRNYLDIFVVAYLDDILVYSENEKDHVQHVQTVLRALD